MLIPILVFVVFFLIIYLFLNQVVMKKVLYKKRIEALNNENEYTVRDDELSAGLVTRLFGGTWKKIESVILKFSPKGSTNNLRIKFAQAGMPNASPASFLIKRTLFTILIPIMMYFIVRNTFESTVQVYTFVGFTVLVIYRVFNSTIDSKIKRRQKNMTKQLPDILDLLTVSVEAGLSFDAALKKVVTSTENDLAEEFEKTLKEMTMGKARRDALKDLSIRANTEDVTTLTGYLIQADELGVPVGNILRQQSIQMREKRRQRAREKSMQAPVKMLIPIVFFIFPSIFIIILGPAILGFIQNF